MFSADALTQPWDGAALREHIREAFTHCEARKGGQQEGRPRRRQERRIAIRYGEDPQRRGECTLLDRPAAQGLHQSVFCSTAL